MKHAHPAFSSRKDFALQNSKIRTKSLGAEDEHRAAATILQISRENVALGGTTGREKTSEDEFCVCVGTATEHAATSRMGISTNGS